MKLQYYILSIILTGSESVLAQTLDEKKQIIHGSGLITPSSILNILLALIFVILMILLFSWLYKKYSVIASPFHDKFKVITGISIGPKEKIILLQIGEEQILVGVAPGVIRNIHTLQNNLVVNEDGKNEKREARGSFIEKLNNELLKLKNT